MINIKDLKLGQKVVLVKKKYENNTHKPELDTFDKAEIVKIGRKYVTVGIRGHFETLDTRKDFKFYNYCERARFGLYLSEKDYFNELKKEKLLKKIRDFFSCSNKECDLLSLEELESINNIVKQY